MNPLHRLTANVQDASSEEAVEILKEIESMDEEDLEISSKNIFRYDRAISSLQMPYKYNQKGKCKIPPEIQDNQSHFYGE